MLTLTLLLGLSAAPLAAPADTIPAGDTAAVQSAAWRSASTDTAVAAVVTTAPADTVRRRPKPIEYSDAYATRLTIHRIGSYTMLPLFAGEYALGQRLMNGNYASWVRPAHGAVALGLGALFTVNTVTGAWNLWEGRSDPAGRTRRFLHSALMIASDAGFAVTGAMGSQSASPADRQRHRNWAIGSMGIATLGTAMMWLWKD